MADNEIILQETYCLVIRCTLSSSKFKSYENIWNLFSYLNKHHLYLFIYYPKFYYSCVDKAKDLCLQLRSEDPDKKEKRLWKLLHQTHQLYIDTYIQTLNNIPGSLPLDLKKSIASYI